MLVVIQKHSTKEVSKIVAAFYTTHIIPVNEHRLCVDVQINMRDAWKVSFLKCVRIS